MEARLVVGAAVLRGGRVLAARRTTPPELAGRWELPGGKVEHGETPDDALAREVAEELGCTVVATEWLPRSVQVRDGLVLRVAVAHLVEGELEPTPVEHDQVCWLGPDELDDVDWLEADRPFLPDLREVLARPRPRGIFDERDDAEQAAAVLRRDGYDAWTERERFAGEDDDEDHAWAVLTDAPDVRLELLVEEHDGWYDSGEPVTPAAPLDLPRAPRR
jgi:8-oxo-dGTP diphosphatase